MVYKMQTNDKARIHVLHNDDDDEYGCSYANADRESDDDEKRYGSRLNGLITLRRCATGETVEGARRVTIVGHRALSSRR